MKNTISKNLKNFLIRTTLRILLAIYCIAVWRLGTVLAVVISRLAWLVARREKAIAIRQIRQALQVSKDEAVTIARANCDHLALSLIETLELYRGNFDLLEHVEFAPGAEKTIESTLAEGSGAVFATGHIGNWELLAAKMCRSGFPLYTLAKSSYDPGLDRIVHKLREGYGITVIDRDTEDVGSRIAEVFEKGALMGLLIDQDTKVEGIFLDFFGKPAHTPTGAGALAMRNAAPLLVCWIHRKGDGHIIDVAGPYTARGDKDRKEEINRLTGLATVDLERAIRKEPEQWVWFHERWKTRPHK